MSVRSVWWSDVLSFAAAAAVLAMVLLSGASAGGSVRSNGQIAFDRADRASTEGDTFVFTARFRHIAGRRGGKHRDVRGAVPDLDFVDATTLC